MYEYIRRSKDLLHPLTYSVPFEVNETHGHSFREITYIFRGEAHNIINEKSYAVSAGSLIFLGPMHYHRYCVKRNTKYEHRDIYVPEEKFRQLCDMLGAHVYALFCDPLDPAIAFMPEDKILSLDMRLRKLQLAQPSDISEDQHAIHLSIVMELVGQYLEAHFMKSPPYPHWLLNLLAEMNRTEVICGDFENLVKISNYSAEHLSREFKRYTGSTLAKYFFDLKMHYALALLINTNISVSEISRQIGYSLSHFIRKFKETYSLSPREYRKNAAGNRQHHV